jgi:3-hydroxyisobutyrate dehydrogenase
VTDVESMPAAGRGTVGFVGIGDMGSAIVERILGAGFAMSLWARRQSSLEPFRESTAALAASPAKVAASSELVGVCVTCDSDVEEVLTGDDGILAGIRPGGIIAVHSTVSPFTCQRLAAAAAERGAELVDAPVSGGRPAAVAGELLVMVGGSDPAFTRCLPVFRTFGSTVEHLGPVGSAQLAKLVNNTLLSGTMALADEALELGRRLEIDETKLGRVLQHGTARSFALDVTLHHRSSPVGSDQASKLLSKDVRLLAGIADTALGGTGGAIFSTAELMLARLAHPQVTGPEGKAAPPS